MPERGFGDRERMVCGIRHTMNTQNRFGTDGFRQVLGDEHLLKYGDINPNICDCRCFPMFCISNSQALLKNFMPWKLHHYRCLRLARAACGTDTCRIPDIPSRHLSASV